MKERSVPTSKQFNVKLFSKDETDDEKIRLL